MHLIKGPQFLYSASEYLRPVTQISKIASTRSFENFVKRVVGLSPVITVIGGVPIQTVSGRGG